MAGKLQTHELLAWFSAPFSASHMGSLLNLSHAAHLEKKKWKYRYGT